MSNNKTPKWKVSIRGGFSDRNGFKTENTTIQTTEFDHRSRVALCNAVDSLCHSIYNSYLQNACQTFIRSVMFEVYTQPVESSEIYNLDPIIDQMKETIMLDQFDSVLSLIEYLAGRLRKDNYHSESVPQTFNKIFESEYIGYRFIGEKVTPITDEDEIRAINESIQSTEDTVALHFQKALERLSDRDKPDYENSIKESISAVEAMCNIILDKTRTLSDSLRQLEKRGIIIHPALKDAFIKLYGYTCDASGIRHAGGLGSPNSTFDEAKFMLVACSAFVNYLKGVSANCGFGIDKEVR